MQVARTLEATSAALSAYVPRPYGGRVALLLGERYTSCGESSPAAEWRKLCTGSFDVTLIPGKDTGAMFRPPHIDIVIARLKALLDHA